MPTDPQRRWFRFVPYRTLLPIAVILCLGGMAVSQDLPRPPCVAAPPDPDYAAAGDPPNIRVWNRRDRAAPWVPPACTGWTAKGTGVLVALAGSFSDSGSSEDLLKRFGSISGLEGVRYWSVSEGGWRTLITHATALEGPDLGRPRKDFTVAEMKEGSDLYFAQSDNRASGEVIYRMQVRQAGPIGLVIAIENMSPVRRFLIPFFEPGDLQSVHYLERKGPGLWNYYGLAWAGENLPSVLRMPEGSYVNRALALYRHFAGTHDPELPP